MANSGRHGADAALLAHLIAGMTMKDAAAAVGVAERTVRRRLEDPSFRAQLQAGRAAVFDDAVGRLSSSTSKAVEALDSLLSARSEMVRYLSARAIVELALKAREQSALEDRLAALEAALATRGGIKKWAA